MAPNSSARPSEGTGVTKSRPASRAVTAGGEGTRGTNRRRAESSPPAAPAGGGANAGEPRRELGSRRRVGTELAAGGGTFVADALADRPGILASKHVLADHRIGKPGFRGNRTRQIREAGDDGADRFVPGF